jgi:hypothetical protein
LGSEACIDNNMLFSGNGEWRLITRPTFDWSTNGPRRWRTQLRVVKHNARKIAASQLLELAMRTVGGTGGHYGLASYPLRLYEHGLGVRRSLANAVEAIRAGRRPCVTPLSPRALSRRAWRASRPTGVEDPYAWQISGRLNSEWGRRDRPTFRQQSADV